MLRREVVATLREVNPWRAERTDVRPASPAYRRPVVRRMAERLAGKGNLPVELRPTQKELLRTCP